MYLSVRMCVCMFIYFSVFCLPKRLPVHTVCFLCQLVCRSVYLELDLYISSPSQICPSVHQSNITKSNKFKRISLSLVTKMPFLLKSKYVRKWTRSKFNEINKLITNVAGIPNTDVHMEPTETPQTIRISDNKKQINKNR